MFIWRSTDRDKNALNNIVIEFLFYSEYTIHAKTTFRLIRHAGNSNRKTVYHINWPLTFCKLIIAITLTHFNLFFHVPPRNLSLIFSDRWTLHKILYRIGFTGVEYVSMSRISQKFFDITSARFHVDYYHFALMSTKIGMSKKLTECFLLCVKLHLYYYI